MKYENILKYLKQTNLIYSLNNERLLNQEILNNTENKEIKASIETSMHILIDKKYVIHTHNILINIFACSKFPESFFKDIFK